MEFELSNNELELSKKYQQKTDHQHILDNPDTYIGAVEKLDSLEWILDKEKNKIVEKNIEIVPGLFKLFDEGIVNCRDHVVRMLQAIQNKVENALPVTYIDISIQEDGTIIMTNDGNGIDVAQHPEYKIWIPELIFGHLRTSTNYDKTEKKIVGGKNGFGFKLVLIWSTFGSVETVDHVRGLKYYQEFKNNLKVIGLPKISKCTGKKPYTKITFKPDYARLGMSGLTPDLIALFQKRVYDVAAVTDKSLKVKYNSTLIPVKNFQQYIDMYIGDKTITPRIYEENGERWEYAVALTPSNEFIQVSFVNGIHTTKGGKHVEYILSQITKKMVEYIEKKKKMKVNPNSIKEQLILFLRCDIENPAFDSQTKDCMNTPFSKFGSKCEVTDKFIEKVAKMGIMDAACAITEVKENKAAKKSDGSKVKSIRGIPKLTDANWAGTERSKDCVIIFCEGDSAKAGIISGLSSEDRNKFGVYPMKGKILNVRGETAKTLADNKEITEIKKILGLENGKKYETIEDVYRFLRYGKILLVMDQDLDGSHIKGLFFNFILCGWPSLTQLPMFIGFMNTPILKARKGNTEIAFYNDGEYRAWKETNDPKNWNIKYFKGLGTSTRKEFLEYFENKKFVWFEDNDNSDASIDLVFNKKRAPDRKTWLENFERDSFLDTSKKSVTYEDFINKEFIHFSKYDCDRSIPNLMDGLKTSLRKILYAAFKRNLTSEIKVAQFSGYVSENAGYHHGEASLNAAIKGMAQNFVGSNNVNLFMPNGQFGSRLKGGKDSAAERYIFTLLNKVTRHIFCSVDDNILRYLEDDGQLVEPTYYAPIIPMVLVNGSKGIGTGFSTEIMCYNPLQIINYLKLRLTNIGTSRIEPITPNQEFVPFYEGFQGTIQKLSKDKFLVKGIYQKIGPDKIKVTELPVGFWTDDFKCLLENLREPEVDKDGKKKTAIVKDFDDNSSDTVVLFVITFAKGLLDELEGMTAEHGCNGLEKVLKLYSTNSTTNMHLFDENDKLKKYDSVEQIIDNYFEVRLKLYQERKNYLVSELEKELVLLTNKARYVKENLDGTIDLRKKKKDVILQLLKDKRYAILETDEEYQYLVKMPMDSVSEENIERLYKERDSKQEILDNTKKQTVYQMWLLDLESLEKVYLKYKQERNKDSNSNSNGEKKKSAKKIVG
jgi:DNA topoisomerase-2